ncbi:hypothetical protein KUCAC02_034734, partial [Chaenocephalus aceratus]
NFLTCLLRGTTFPSLYDRNLLSPGHEFRALTQPDFHTEKMHVCRSVSPPHTRLAVSHRRRCQKPSLAIGMQPSEESITSPCLREKSKRREVWHRSFTAGFLGINRKDFYRCVRSEVLPHELLKTEPINERIHQQGTPLSLEEGVMERPFSFSFFFSFCNGTTVSLITVHALVQMSPGSDRSESGSRNQKKDAMADYNEGPLFEAGTCGHGAGERPGTIPLEDEGNKRVCVEAPRPPGSAESQTATSPAAEKNIRVNLSLRRRQTKIPRGSQNKHREGGGGASELEALYSGVRANYARVVLQRLYGGRSEFMNRVKLQSALRPPRVPHPERAASSGRHAR